MTMRLVKQLIYGAAFFALWAGIIAGVYFRFIKPAPSCFDHIQNQGEEGVDCGGPCAAVCLPPDLEKISVVGSPLAFISSPGRYTLLGQVANKNTGFAAPRFDYRFDLYDATGTLIASIPGQSFIYTGEVKYLLVPIVDIPPPASVDRVALAVSNPNWTNAASLGLVPQLTARMTTNIVSSNTITVNGRMVNEDISSFNNILVVAVFYDAANSPAGASQTVIDRIAPNETAEFSVVYPAMSRVDPLRTKFFPYALRP